MPSFTRAAQIDLDATPYYHCIARCVRRAFLCGDDPYTGENFDHRKPWFLRRLKLAADVFAIDICAFAVLSNHFHAVLRVDSERASVWTDEAVLRRYAKLFPNAARVVRELPRREKQERLRELRARLTSISWFMRVVCENIARRANIEDEVTGRFWEGRFKCQALLDDGAVFACMSYVDLNPVRAGIASSLAGSKFTSIKQRLDQAGSGTIGEVPLAPFRGERDAGKRRALDFRFEDYVALLDWTGRAQRTKPGGRLRGAPPAVLASLGIDGAAWLAAMAGSALSSMTSIGCQQSLELEAARRGCRWLRGQRASSALLDSASESTLS